MKFARLFLAAVAVSALAACTVDSPTAPTAPPLMDGAENAECSVLYSEVQPDGSVVWRCSPSMGSGG